MGHDHGESVERQEETGRQAQLRPVDIASHRLHRRDRVQLPQHVEPPDVAGVEDHLDSLEGRQRLRSQQ